MIFYLLQDTAKPTSGHVAQAKQEPTLLVDEASNCEGWSKPERVRDSIEGFRVQGSEDVVIWGSPLNCCR